MKFTEELVRQATPTWRKQYIEYEELKKMLYTGMDEAPDPLVTEAEYVARHYAKIDENFFNRCDTNIKKINTFYSEKLAEATRKYNSLNSELQSILDKKASGKLLHIELAFSEYYLSLILLQRFKTINSSGFVKILEKHDQCFSSDAGYKYQTNVLDNAFFVSNTDINKLIQDTENLVTAKLAHGNRQKAMQRLRVPPLGEEISAMTSFKVGLLCGSFIVLTFTIVLSAMFYVGDHVNFVIAIKLYRGPFLIIQLIFLIGINVYGWRRAGVNHILIFELDPRNHVTDQDLLQIGAFLAVMWSINLLIFLYSSIFNIPRFASPFALFLFIFAFLINPIKMFWFKARFWLCRLIVRILCAPFLFVKFPDFWLGDQLNSMVFLFGDYHYMFCFYISNGSLHVLNDNHYCEIGDSATSTFMKCMPAWIRFWQCLRRYHDTNDFFPHLPNAVKYFTIALAFVCQAIYHRMKGGYVNDYDDPYFYIFMITSIVNGLFLHIWDLIVDWGLLLPNPGEYFLLREELIYCVPLYYFSMVINFICRFLWIVAYIGSKYKFMNVEVLGCILAVSEVFRRFFWNYIRLENEHLNNCGKFRAVRDISLAPIDSSDQAEMVKMMDSVSGVRNRKANITKKEYDDIKED